MKNVVFCLFVLATGCASTRTHWDWAPAELLAAPAATAYPKDDAVYLLRERRVVLASSWSASSHVYDERHDVLAVLTEDGFDYANVRVLYPETGSVTNFAARTINADGTISEVTAFNVHDDDAYKTKKSNWKARIFTFPDVKVGSIIEYRYTIDKPGLFYSLDEFLNERIPIEKYRLELWGTRDIIYSTKAYQTTQKWGTGSQGPFWTLVWTEEKVPPTIDEQWAPARTLRDPWWVFTIQQFAKYNVVVDINRSWATALARDADELYFDNAKYYADFAPKLEVPAGATPLAIATAVHDYARERWPVSDTGALPGRKAREIEGATGATGVERARAMWKMLRDRGVEAKLAMVNSVGERLEDKDMPFDGAYRGLVVYLPVQPSIPAARWIDGSCDYCTLGEVPPWLDGAEAMVINATKGMTDDRPAVTPEWITMRGPPPTPTRRERSYRVTITSTGSLAMDVSVRALGYYASALRHELRTTEKKDRSENLASGLRARQPGLRLGKREDAVIYPGVRQAQWSYAAGAARHVVAAGDRRVVPLSFMDASNDSLFEKEERELPVVITSPVVLVETAEITVPAGWKLHDLPATHTRSEPGLTCRIKTAEKGPSAVTVTTELTYEKVQAPLKQYPDLRSVARTCVELRRSAVTFTAP